MYTHFTEKDPGGIITMYIDRHREIGGKAGYGGLVVPVALGCTMVKLADKPSKDLLAPSLVETYFFGGGSLTGDDHARRGEALAKAERHATLESLVDSAKATWHQLLEGEVAEITHTGLATKQKPVPREETVTDSGLVVIGSKEELAVALAEPKTEFDGYIPTPDEIAAIESIGLVPVDYGAVRQDDVLNRLYL